MREIVSHNKHLPIMEMAELYNNGESACSIASKYGVYKGTVGRLFRRYNIPMRNQSEAEILSFTNNPSHRINLSKSSRDYTLNQDFLKELTPITAYVLGFLQADVALSKDRWNLGIQVGDREFLETISKLIGSNRPLLLTHHEFGDIIRLPVNSTEMVNDLNKWGIYTPRRSHPKVHELLRVNRDYWRGVMDGDGTICITKTGKIGNRIMRLVGMEDVCQQFLNFAREYGCGMRVKVHSWGNSYNVRLNGKEAVKMANVLYKDSQLYLPRKYAIYQQYFAQ